MPEERSQTRGLPERLSRLFEQDPGLFERQSRQLIEQLIESFSAERRARARGLQFRLDAELGRYRDPVARMNRMVEIFWEQVGQFLAVLNDPGQLLAERETAKRGEVVPLARAEKLH